MIAPFDGVCAHCVNDIDEGVHEIHHDPGEGGWVHTECPVEREMDCE